MLLAHSDRPFGADQFYGNYPSWERTRTWFAALRQQLGKRTEIAFAWRRHTDLFVLDRSKPAVFTNRHAVQGLQAVFRRWEELRRNIRLHYGVEGLRDSIRSSNLGSHSRSTGAAYAALDIRALGRASFSIGVREQVYGARRTEVSPTLAAGLWLSGSLKLKGSFSRAFRLPSYTDLYYQDPASVGSPNLRPESAWSFDAGLDWNAGRRIRGEVTLFHRRESDGIDYVRVSESDIWRATNIQRLHFTGMETSVSLRATHSQEVSLTYMALRGSSRQLVGLLSRYVFNYPSHAAVASWQAALPGKIVGRVRIGATQRLERAPYAIADLYLARSSRRFSPFVQVTNAWNVTYEEVPHVPMPGRGLVVGVEAALPGLFN